MAKELGFVSYVILEDGNTVELSALSGEQKELLWRNTRERLSRNMSDYYTQHPEELKALK